MPLRTDIIPKFIPLDTKSLIEIFVEKDKNKYLCDIENTKDELWSKYFNIPISMKKYVFDYTIITDCYSASLRFIHKDKLQAENDKKEKMRNAKLLYKGMTKEEKEILKKKKKEEQKLMNKNKPKIKKETVDYIEFPYIDEVDKLLLDRKKCVFIDPGKTSLLSMIDDEGNRFTYSNKQRVKETKRLKYQRLIKNLKDTLGICEIENTLSIYNSKTCDIEKFKIYIEEKNKVNDKLFKLYENEKFRQYKWYAYINKKRAEDNMSNLIKNKFGENINLIYGNWSIKKQMRNFISTPNLGVKRKLKETFNVFNIDEYRTSCLYYKTEEKGNNFYITDTIILDIFSGTGNISYEFASRGSKHITSVDINNKCINFIKSVSNELSFNLKTIKSDVYKFIKSCNLDFDIIFADPPYNFEIEKYEKLISLIIKKNLLKNDGLLIIEHSKNISLKNSKNYSESREYGRCCFSFFKS